MAARPYPVAASIAIGAGMRRSLIGPPPRRGEVEGLDTEETEDCLGISAASVKVRLHRALALLRSDIDAQLGTEVRRLHQFAGARCDGLVAAVLERIG